MKSCLSVYLNIKNEWWLLHSCQDNLANPRTFDFGVGAENTLSKYLQIIRKVFEKFVF